MSFAAKRRNFKCVVGLVDGVCMGRRVALVVLAVAAMAGPAMPARATVSGFTDVANGAFAQTEIRAVAYDRDWMRDFGLSSFRPDAMQTRRQFAVALVRSFGRTESADPALILSDVAPTDWALPAMRVAVRKGWMSAPGGVFSPNAALTKAQMDVGLINALGLQEEVLSLARIRGDDGYQFKTPYAFGQMIIAAEMGLHYKHSTVWRNTLPYQPIRRSDVAYALWKAATAHQGWKLWAARKYRGMTLPAMTAERRRVVEWSFAYAGWPYVYAGEWATKTPSSYCCGAQAQGGFDCSGFVWWVLHSRSATYPVPRSYNGWSFAERSSATMGRAAPRRLYSTQLTPMDIVLFDSDGSKGDWSTIDHAGLALGNGWMIHSSGGRGGVSISWIGDGFWRDHFYWGRRIIPGPDPVPPPPVPEPEPTPTVTPDPTVTPSP